MSLDSLLNVAPAHPDFHICDAAYGSDLLINDCSLAKYMLVTTAHEENYYWGNPHSPNNFPITADHGRCHIAVEAAGAVHSQLPIPISRRVLNELASWLIRQCTIGRNGLGGMVTRGMGPMVEHYQSITATDELLSSGPESTHFITVTITDKDELSEPGDHDPAIPLAIVNAENVHVRNHPADRSNDRHKDNAAFFTRRAERMIRGGRISWWDNLHDGEFTDTTAYECDAGLGTPSEVDCTQIEWHQLRPASDSLKVQAGEVLFYHSNTCYLAISSTMSLVLNWGQIRTALSTLLSVCVQPPNQFPQGGRAYYAPQPLRVSGLGHVNGKGRGKGRGTGRGRGKGKGKRGTGLTGWNALPPHANITVFQQIEPWTNPVDELKSCTWNAVIKGTTVKGCIRQV